MLGRIILKLTCRQYLLLLNVEINWMDIVPGGDCVSVIEMPINTTYITTIQCLALYCVIGFIGSSMFNLPVTSWMRHYLYGKAIN